MTEKELRQNIAMSILPFCAETTRSILWNGHGLGDEFAGMTIPQAVAKQAVEYADALIEELKSREVEK